MVHGTAVPIRDESPAQQHGSPRHAGAYCLQQHQVTGLDAAVTDGGVESQRHGSGRGVATNGERVSSRIIWPYAEIAAHPTISSNDKSLVGLGRGAKTGAGFVVMLGPTGGACEIARRFDPAFCEQQGSESLLPIYSHTFTQQFRRRMMVDSVGGWLIRAFIVTRHVGVSTGE